MWSYVVHDANALLANDHVEALLQQPLWPGDSGIPDWACMVWDDFQSSSLHQKLGFAPWMAWYEALLPLQNGAVPRNIFGRELALKIALQPKEWWERGAKAVNADVAGWLGLRPTQMDKATKAKEIARLNDAYFAARAKAADRSVENHLRGDISADIKTEKGDGAEWVDALAELDKLLGRHK
jgi:hypothetical protein